MEEGRVVSIWSLFNFVSILLRVVLVPLATAGLVNLFDVLAKASGMI